MYAVGDKIIYGGSGVCTVEEICTPNFSRAERGRQYYKLRPVYGTETIYAPIDTAAFMRPVMSRQEAEALIARIPVIGAAVALSFADCWNLVEQPMTYLSQQTELQPLSVMFNQLVSQSTGVEFAGAVIYILPALFVYLYFLEDILSGIQLTELK